MKICPVCSTEYSDDVKFCPKDGQTLRSATPASDLVGQIVADRYHVLKKLGEGGMGQVYLAEHVKMGRRSAIKVLNPSMVHDPDAITRFNREASNASRISHPNVCAIYDFGETQGGLIFLAMEFVDGEPLTDLLEREGALSLPRATNIFLQTADALQAAHDLGIVHRDLKPDNVMVTKGRGGVDTVKVVDFGIAKAIGGDAAGQKVTKTGLVIGTPEFMSPEQLSGDTLDGRSDLYSLALVYFHMLTGKVPFAATSVQEIMVKRLTDEPSKLTAVRPDLSFPPGLQQVLDTALARTPTERYQSVTKFAGDVASITGRPAVGVVPPTESKTVLLAAPESATQLIPRKKRSVFPVAAAVVLVLAVGGAWVVLNGAGNNTSAVPPDTASPVDSSQSRDSGARVAARPPAPPPTRAPKALDPARAGDSLDVLVARLESIGGRALRDAALEIYSTPGVSARNQALAAYLAANGFAKLDDSASTCTWARRAVTHDPAPRAYAALRQSICGS